MQIINLKVINCESTVWILFLFALCIYFCCIFFVTGVRILILHFIMEVNRLLGDELTYELLIRGGKSDGTVEEKRQRLRAMLRLEQLGSLPSFQSIPLDSNEQLQICDTKILELIEAVIRFDRNNAKNEYNRIQTRILHVIGRLNRITEEHNKETQQRLLVRCVELTEELEKIMLETNPRVLNTSLIDQPIANLQAAIQAFQSPQDPRPSAIPIANLLDPASENNRDIDNAQQRESPTAPPVVNSTSHFEQRIRQMNFPEAMSPPFRNLANEDIPVVYPNLTRFSTNDNHFSTRVDPSRSFTTISKWNLRFNGNSSVTNFIERAEELRLACGISKTHLVNCAVTLFEGTALSWFRAVRDSIHSWEDLVEKLRATYLSAEYDEDIWNDIRNRTQGEGEKTAVFIAIMENLFSKLSKKPDEASRLRMIRRNLLPFVQNQLALHPINSLTELITACRHVEDVLVRTQRLRPPPTNPNLVTEPELMYRRPRYPNAAVVSNQPEDDLISFAEPNTSAIHALSPTSPGNFSNRSSVVCWNCRKTGHVKRNCTQPLSKHCFKCGTANETTRTCPKCSGKGSPSHEMTAM